MLSQSKGKSSKAVIERPGISWREASLDSSSLILSVVKEAATLAPITELKKPACTALLIFKTTQLLKENKEEYERLGYDSGGLIVAIWRSFKKAEDPEEWLSAGMRDILEDLSNTLENICSFVNEQLSKSKAIRVIFSRAGGVKINEHREHLNYAMQKFELQSHMNTNDVLKRILRKNDQISEQILHRDEEDEVRHVLEIRARDTRDREIPELDWLKQVGQVGINFQTYEQWHSDELSDVLKKIDKKAKESELERLRGAAAACGALDEAKRLRQAEEEEIAQLKRALAAQEDNRRSNKIRARQSEKKSSRQEGEVDEEEYGLQGRAGNFICLEGEGEWLVRETRSSKVKRNASGPGSPTIALEDSTDDDEEDLQFSLRLKTARRKLSSALLPEEDSQSMRSAKTRITHRNLSSASLRVQETEDDYTDEEDDSDYAPPPPRKSLKAKRKPQTRNVDDLMAQFQGFTQSSPHWNGSNSRSGSPMYMPPGMPYYPTYGPGGPFSPIIGPYGYGVGTPATVVYAGVGNTTNTTMANVGNDNSVVKNLKGHAVEAFEVIRVRRLELVVLILWYTIFSVYSHLLTC